MSEDVKKALQEHIESDQRLFEVITQKLEKILDNHLFHLEKDSATTTANVDWLMKTYWLVAGASIGGLITGVLNLILK